jgi:hypothetical protein
MWNEKLDGYPIPARNPTGTGTGMNFYPWIRVQISTRSLFAGGRVIALPDLLPSLVVSMHLASRSPFIKPNKLSCRVIKYLE